MGKQTNLMPRAELLIESLRFIGYNFNSAIADIVDNSLSAKANLININYDPQNVQISILDNGKGMNKKELLEAMRFGSKDPLMQRDLDDLGRFGLGLKSASFSQCRKFTVLSKSENKIHGFIWDLDVVRNTGNWTVIELNDDELKAYYFYEVLLNQKSGTCVIWENFDKISISSASLEKTIEKLVNELRDYLALVFHEYLLNDVVITVNDLKLPIIDPFLEESTFTQKFKVEPIPIVDKDGNKNYISVTPYVLPHFSDMTQSEKEMVGGINNYKSKQGFYIYRNKRLILWGTWFRIVPNNELYKNARVKVNIPNNLDYIWSIDVKKSTATIPPLIKHKLFHSVQEAISSSKSIYKKRAININKELGYDCIWEIIKERDKIYYKINRDLPMLRVLYSRLDDESIKILDIILNDVENNLPQYSIFTNLSEGNIDENKEDLKKIIERILTFFNEANITEKKDRIMMLKNLCKTEPYCEYKDLYRLVLKEYKYD